MKEEIRVLEKRIKVLASRMMTDEIYFEKLKSKIKVAEKLEKDTKVGLIELETATKKEKEDFLAYKKTELGEISQKRTTLRTLQDKIETQDADSDARVEELNALSKRLDQEANDLIEDKRDINKQDQKLKEKKALLDTVELRQQDDKITNDKKANLLTQIETNLDKQQEKNKSQLKYISEHLIEISEGRATNALEASRLNSQQQGIVLENKELGRKRDFIISETQKLDILSNNLDERVKGIETREKSYEGLLGVLKDYENELELKRLILVNEIRKKDIKLKIEKLKQKV